MRIVPIVIAATAATSCGRPPAPPPVQPVANRAPEVRTGGAAPCARIDRTVRLDRISQAEGVQYQVRPEGELAVEPVAAMMWSADINDDRINDVQLRFADSCGNYGECVIGVFVGCGHGRYAAVLPPDYHYQLELGTTTTPVDGRVWTDLIDTPRTEHDILSPQPLRFDGDRYR